MSETTLSKITDHVYWMSPGEPDRPSLCAVVGTNRTLMLEAGASDAHARLFLDALSAAKVRHPDYVALTHWHWDHIFGAAELDVPVIAHWQTAAEIAIQAGYEWTDKALYERVANGKEIAFCADNIKLELPEPRQIRFVQPDIVYRDSLDINLGDVQVHLQHVGGDHAADSCVMHILPDKVLFLGDCLYDAIYTPVRHYTTKKVFPLLDIILSFDADYYVEGHTPTVMSRAELMTIVDKMRMVGKIVDELSADEAAVKEAVTAEMGTPLDEDTLGFIQTFIAGQQL
ncbi:MAG: MBL fold metallo-hydrolase [Anaerolineaceae bacterium]|nr:MBL fold metallo-hydrolase [Anaerolineaceae bacterium]